MKKIPTIFKRDPYDLRRVMPEINPVCDWVFRGEGQATRKWDGTACLIKDGKLYKRYDCRKGNTPPEGFIAADVPDAISGHWPGWVLVGDGPEDKWHREGFANYYNLVSKVPEDGTYELVHPRYQGRDSHKMNPEGAYRAALLKHGDLPLAIKIEHNYPPVQQAFSRLKIYFELHDLEGIVWHHPDGRMAKIKARDLGVGRGSIVGTY